MAINLRFLSFALIHLFYAMLVRGLSGLALGFALLGSVAAVEPNDIYWGSHNDSSPNIALRIGNGGAGQSGLVKGSKLSSPLIVRNIRD